MKSIFFAAVAATAIVSMTACSGGFSAKEVKLANQNDSLNYTLGLANGAQIKQFYLASDSSKNAVTEFIKAIDFAYKNGKGKTELYQQGYAVGQWLKSQEKSGILESANYKLNLALVKQGLANAFAQFNDSTGLSAGAAQGYLQQTMMKIQQEKFQQQQPAELETESHEGHQHE